MNAKRLKSMHIKHDATQKTLQWEMEENVDISYELTAENIINERQRQIERESRKSCHQESKNKQDTHNVIQQECGGEVEKGQTKVQQDYHSGTKKLPTNLCKTQTPDRQESTSTDIVHDNNDMLESGEDANYSFQLTPENIAYERQLQRERESLQRYHQQDYMEKKKKGQFVRNPQPDYCIGMKKMPTNPSSKAQTKGQHESKNETDLVNENNLIFESDEDGRYSFQLTPENIANERLKQIEREAKGLPRQIRQSPPTEIAAKSDVMKTERDRDGDNVTSQKSPYGVPINNGDIKSFCCDRRRVDSDDAVEHIPGAFAIRGIDAAGNDSSLDSILFSIPFSSKLLVARPVEEDSVAACHSHRAEEEVWEKIKAESVTASEVNVDNEDKEANGKAYYIRLVLVLVMVSSLALGLGLGLSRHKKKSNMTTISAPSPSSLQPDSNFTYLQELFWSISEDAVFDSSSIQYEALKWLVYEDTFDTDVKNIEVLKVRYALAVLYFSTDGSNWRDNTNYLTNAFVCDWKFIGCNVLESVVEIKMDSNNLNGKIPSELASISSLEGISFPYNDISSTIPTTIGNLSRLKYFDVESNSLSGTIPDSFSRLTNLEKLNLSVNKLTGTIPGGLTYIRKLEVLTIRHNSLSGTIPSFAQQGLEDIDLLDNKLVGPIPSSMINLSNLENVDFTNNMLTGTIPSGIDGMKKLSSLSLEDNLFRGTIPTTIGEIEFMEDIRLSRNRFNGTIPTEIGQLTRIVRLTLDGNQITGTLPSELGHLSNLLRFSVYANVITGTVPLSMSKLTSFEYIHLRNTSISGDLDAVFCDGQSNNVIINLDADCRGTSPEVNCTCCTMCCEDESGGCEVSLSQICKNFALDFESVSDAAICTCAEDLLSVSCKYLDCQTCNEDSTICGASTEFGSSNWEMGHSYGNLTNTFTYQTGRNETVLWQENRNDADYWCRVSVNGEECHTCSLTVCDDSFVGIHIDCTNVVEGEPGLYDSCNPFKIGGVFDVFSWMELGSWTGCPFVFNGPNW